MSEPVSKMDSASQGVPALPEARPAVLPVDETALPPLALVSPPEPVPPAPPSLSEVYPPAPAPFPRPPSRAKIIRWTFLLVAAHLVLTGAAVAVAAWNYSLALHLDFLRSICLWAVIVAAATATLTLGGMMLGFDRLLDLSPPPHWSWRWLIDPIKRLVLAGQLVTTASIILAIAVMVLKWKLPVIW